MPARNAGGKLEYIEIFGAILVKDSWQHPESQDDEIL